MKKLFSSKNKKVIILAKIGIYSVLLLFAAIFAFRVFANWSEPACAPTGCNVSAPLNTSTTTQTIGNGTTDLKSIIGNFNLSGTLGAGSLMTSGNLIVGASPSSLPSGSNICFNGDCRSAWPSSSSASSSSSSNLSGGGTANYVSKWTGSTSLGNSLIYDNGSNIGIGTISPSQKLDVNGNINVEGKYIFVKNSSNYFGSDGNNIGAATPGAFYVLHPDESSPADIHVRNVYAQGDTISKIFVNNSSNYFGSDGNNIGAATPGEFYVLHPDSTFTNVKANDYWINAIGKWASQLTSTQSSLSGYYQCPYQQTCDDGQTVSGNWASYGCVAQVTNKDFCSIIWWNGDSGYHCNNPCTPI